MLKAIITAIINATLGRLTAWWTSEKKIELETKNAAVAGREKNLEDSYKTEKEIADAQNAVAKKAEAEKVTPPKTGIQNDVLGASNWNKVPVIIVMTCFFTSVGCSPLTRYAHVADRRPEIEETEKPTLDNISINWSALPDKEAEALRLIIENFQRMRVYALKQEVSIKVYNLRAKIHNIGVKKVITKTEPTQEELDEIANLASEIKALTSPVTPKEEK